MHRLTRTDVVMLLLAAVAAYGPAWNQPWFVLAMMAFLPVALVAAVVRTARR